MSKTIALLLLQIAAFWPVWIWYGKRIAAGSADDQWGLLAAVTAIAFLWLHRTKLTAEIHWLMPTFLTLLYAATWHWLPPMLRAIIAITALGFTLSQSCQQRFLHPAIAGLLLLSLPVIPLLQFYLGYPLRIVVGSLTAPMLQLSGLAVVREGTCLNWNGQIIAIDAPCSGIKMLWTGFYLVFTLACFYRLSAGKTILASLAALPVIVAGNALRAAGLFYLETGIAKLPVIVSPNFAHEAIGVAIFLLIAIALVVLVRLIQKREFTTENLCDFALPSSSPAS